MQHKSKYICINQNNDFKVLDTIFNISSGIKISRKLEVSFKVSIDQNTTTVLWVVKKNARQRSSGVIKSDFVNCRRPKVLRKWNTCRGICWRPVSWVVKPWNITGKIIQCLFWYYSFISFYSFLLCHIVCNCNLAWSFFCS